MATSQGCRVLPLAEMTAIPVSSSHNTNHTRTWAQMTRPILITMDVMFTNSCCKLSLLHGFHCLHGLHSLHGLLHSLHSFHGLHGFHWRLRSCCLAPLHSLLHSLHGLHPH